MSKANENKITNYSFCFQCPLGWHNLEKTEEDKTRYCIVCKKNVHFVETQSELETLSGKEICVAFAPYDSEIEKARREKEERAKESCQTCGTPFHPENSFCLNCGEKNPNSKTTGKWIPGVPDGVVMGQIIPTIYCKSCYKQLPFEGRYDLASSDNHLCDDCKPKVKEKSWWQFWK